jgi:hypothetical protein
MAGKKTTIEQLVERINIFLAYMAANKGKDDNNTIIKKYKIEQSQFYTMKRRLKLLGRMNDKGIVTRNKEVTVAEYIALGDPYQKSLRGDIKKNKGKKKVARKKVAAGTGTPALKDPIEVPVMEHPSGAKVTIEIPVKELVAYFLQWIRTGGIK